MADKAGDTQYFSPDYKEGDLQIVEVTPFEANDEEGNSDGAHILPEIVCEDQETRYMVETENGPMELDLMNLTFVRCEDSEDTFQLQIAGVEEDAEADTEAGAEAGSVACVLRGRTDSEGLNQYTVVNGDKEQLVILTARGLANAQPEAKEAPARPAASAQPKPVITLTPIELLEKKKTLQKSRATMIRQHARSALNCGSRGGRKRRGAPWGGGGGGGRGASALPPPRELLAAPNFRLYLYSCKLCDYKCNALKELRDHKAAEHAGGGGRSRAGGAGRAGQPLQCARCPYRAAHHTQLMKHAADAHTVTTVVTVEMDEEGGEEGGASGEEGGASGEEGGASRVCSLCGHEAASRRAYRDHMAAEHS